MKTKIIGLSGKKQSGKNTAANYIIGLWLKAVGVADDFSIDDKGCLVTQSDGYQSYFDILKCNEEFKKEYLDDFIRIYSFADILKKSVCIDILGLSYEQCFGTDEEKNTLTHLKWENMPGVYTNDEMYQLSLEANPELEDVLIYHKPGFMTAREVMQFIGTEIFRKMYGNVWVDATIRAIEKDRPVMAVITDTRFINEVEGVQKYGGKVVRLTRDIYKGQDQHQSETALDNFNSFDISIDNENMSIDKQNEILHKYLSDINYIPKSIEEFFKN